MDKDIEQIGGTFHLDLKGNTASPNAFIDKLEQCMNGLQTFMDTDLNFAGHLYKSERRTA